MAIGIADDPGITRPVRWLQPTEERRAFDILKPLSDSLSLQSPSKAVSTEKCLDAKHILQLASQWNTRHVSKIRVFLRDGSGITNTPAEECRNEPKPVCLCLVANRWEVLCCFQNPAESITETTTSKPRYAEGLVAAAEPTVAVTTSEDPGKKLRTDTNDEVKPVSTQQYETANINEAMIDAVRNTISKLRFPVVNISEAALNMEISRREVLQPSIDALYYDFREVTKDGLVALETIISDVAKDDEYPSDEGHVNRKDADSAAYQAADRDDSESDSD